MISLRNVMKSMDWNGKKVELGKVYSNPYVNAFKINEEEDHEVFMGQSLLDDIIKNATELKEKIGETETDIPAWIQDHISQSQNFINQANTGYYDSNSK
jgi:hypothetical protein